MLKIEELTYNFINQFTDFERDLVLTSHFHSDWEADILLVNSEGFSHEIEIKFSKNDFKNDFKKHYLNQKTGEKFLKHDKICCGDYLCNSFSFLLPMGMIEHSDIPEHCGIIEFYHNPDVWKTEFYHLRKPKKVHEQNFWELVDKDTLLKTIARNYYFKKLENKGKLEELILPNQFIAKK